ncbi:MAG: ATP F0F1 synthase subunit B [Pseudomonadota bacterium]
MWTRTVSLAFALGAFAPAAVAATDGPWYTDPAKGLALLALIIFFAIVWRAGGFGLVTSSIDSRGSEIQARITEAKALRDQATKMLAEAESKQKQATEEASRIVTQAKADAETLLKKAEADIKDRIERREAQAEARIARAEAEAAAEVRQAAANAATQAAKDLLSKTAPADQFDTALDEVEKALG